LVRIGKISSIDKEKCTARVVFEDKEDLVSDNLPIIIPTTSADKFYYMPQIGERVVCAFMENAPSKGFILGSFYAENREPSVKDENKFYVEFEDETIIQYDKKEHKLKVEIPNGDISIEVKAKGDVNIQTDKDVNIKAKGNITANSDSGININAKEDIVISSQASVTLTAPTINCDC
jgi:phage baseplate assembly protein V